MSEDNTKLELARRAYECKHWRWMPGARDLSSEFGPRRILAVLADGTQVLSAHETIGAFPEQTTVRSVAAFTLPDLDDPATVGCLLALVREAWGLRRAHLQWQSFGDHAGSWALVDSDGDLTSPRVYGHNEAEALVAALEAAP